MAQAADENALVQLILAKSLLKAFAAMDFSWKQMMEG